MDKNDLRDLYDNYVNRDTIKLLNDLIYYNCNYKDWKKLVFSTKGFNLLVDYICYLQEKICYLEGSSKFDSFEYKNCYVSEYDNYD